MWRIHSLSIKNVCSTHASPSFRLIRKRSPSPSLLLIPHSESRILEPEFPLPAYCGEKGPEGPLKQIPMGRVGTVAETAALIVALCSDDTSYMTGVTVDINGASYAA